MRGAIVLLGPGPTPPWPVRYLKRWLSLRPKPARNIVSIGFFDFPGASNVDLLHDHPTISFPAMTEDRGPITALQLYTGEALTWSYAEVHVPKHPEIFDRPFIPPGGLLQRRIGVIRTVHALVSGKSRAAHR